MGYRRTSEPAEEPITLGEAKTHLNVDYSDHDDYITSLISTARAAAENRMRRTVSSCTWVLTLDDFSDSVWLPRPRVAAINSVKYYDMDGIEQTLDPSEYSLDNSGEIENWLMPAYGGDWPAVRPQINAVTITYTAGWDSRAEIPYPIKHWIKLALGAWYDVRAGMDIAPLPMQAFVLPRTFFPELLDTWVVPGF